MASGLTERINIWLINHTSALHRFRKSAEAANSLAFGRSLASNKRITSFWFLYCEANIFPLGPLSDEPVSGRHKPLSTWKNQQLCGEREDSSWFYFFLRWGMQ
jgi:hypothetical protein